MRYLLFLLLLTAATVSAEKLPKIELGVGFATQHLRDYRGSTEAQTQGLPFPFLIYRGERFQADKDAIKGRFLEGDNWELNLSAEGALNGGSGGNSARAGMPELNSAGEIGPSLNINLSGESVDEGWVFRFPVRAVLAVDTSSIEHIGYNANPKFTFRKPDVWRGWNGKVDLGALWATQAYHQYYYGVDDVHVTPERNFYAAESGFSGTYLKASMKKRVGKFWLGWNLRYDYLGATVFQDSPLMETDHYFSTTFAVSYFFWRSQ